MPTEIAAPPHAAPAFRAPRHMQDLPGLADLIPLTARAVLLLGCGEGGIGAQFRASNPAARLIGIEADPTRAAQASAVLDRVYRLDPGGPFLPRFEAPLDCILVSPGVFEAMATPDASLSDLAGMLSADGAMVLVQSVGDEANRSAAIDAMRRRLEAAGLTPVDAQPLGKLPPSSHIAWRARRRPGDTLTVLSTMLPPIGGVSEVRVVDPLHALASIPGVVTRIVERVDDVPPAGPGPSIFILHRPALLGRHGLQTLRPLLERGWLVVCEFDDHPSQIPILHRADVLNFRGVHAIQTSTPALARVFAGENPEVATFANAVSTLPVPRNFADPDRITLLFAALNREHDWPDYLPALNAVAALAGPRLHFHVVADRAFHDGLQTPFKQFTPLCDYGEYLAILAECEVSFMPLRDTQFNRSKSDLKFLEAASRRVVALASPVAYANSIADGRNGVLFADPAMLEARLRALVANPGRARAIADRARAEVSCHRMMAHQVADRIAWYKDLWSRRAALHASLLARVPALAGG